MTKRLLALVLVCILAIPILVVPASATSYTGEYDYSIWYELSRIYSKLSGLVDSLDAYLMDLWTEASTSNEWLQGISNYILMLMEKLAEYHTDITTWLEAIYGDMIAWFETINTNLVTFFDNWVAGIADFKSSVSSGFGMLQTYITSIQSQISGLANGTQTHRNEAAEMETEAATQATEFQENMDVIQDWTRPDYEADFDPSVEGITNGVDTGEYTEALYVFFDVSAYFTTLLFMAFSFSVISFVVFGKR